MKKITEKLLSEMAKAYLEECLDRNDEFFEEYVTEIAEEEKLHPEKLADEFSRKLNKVLKSIK